jgi:Mrp family chromosome partitioning ATPase
MVGKAAPDDLGRSTSRQENHRGAVSHSDWPRTLYHTPPPAAYLQAAQATLPVDRRVVDACASAALKLGGPRLSRLGVTSALRGEGRTTIALAMAAVQSREFGRRALLVDADFESPSLGSMFGFAGEPGLAEVTTGEVSIDAAVREVAEGVALLPAGVATKHRSRMVRELLSSDLLEELSGLYEVAIVDLPPMLGSTEGPLLAAHFQNALLVVRAQVTPIARIEEAVGMLPAQPFVMVNGVNSSLPRWLSRLVDRG